VYKTVRVGNLSQLPYHIAILMAYMVGGLTLLGVAMWLVQYCFA
jgi:hypothetical protein